RPCERVRNRHAERRIHRGRHRAREGDDVRDPRAPRRGRRAPRRGHDGPPRRGRGRRPRPRRRGARERGLRGARRRGRPRRARAPRAARPPRRRRRHGRRHAGPRRPRPRARDPSRTARPSRRLHVGLHRRRPRRRGRPPGTGCVPAEAVLDGGARRRGAGGRDRAGRELGTAAADPAGARGDRARRARPDERAGRGGARDLAGDRPVARPERDAEAACRHAHGGGREGPAALVDRIALRQPVDLRPYGRAIPLQGSLRPVDASMSEPDTQPTTPAITEVTRMRAAVDISLQLLGRSANVVLGVVVTLVLARHLGPRDFGRWSTIFAVFQITGYFGNLGFEQAAVARCAAEPEREPQWLGALVALRLLLALPVFLATTGIMLLVARGGEMRLAGVIVCAMLLVSGLGSLRAVFQLRVRNHVTAWFELANGILWGIGVILVAAAGGRLVALAAVFLGTAAATILLQAAVAVHQARISFAGVAARARTLARVAIPIGIGGLLILAYVRIDQVLVFELASPDAAGDYGAAYRVLDRVQLLPDAFLATLFPLLVSAYRVDSARLRRLVQTAFDYLLMLSLPLLAFTVVASEPIVELLFGGRFEAASRALPILMGAFVLIALGYLGGNLVIVLDRQKTFVRYALLALVVNVVGNVVLIPPYGFVAAAWMTLATEAVVLALTARLVFREAGFRPGFGRAA